MKKTLLNCLHDVFLYDAKTTIMKKLCLNKKKVLPNPKIVKNFPTTLHEIGNRKLTLKILDVFSLPQK